MDLSPRQDFRIDVFMSLVRAMWDLVTPDLRSVSVKIPRVDEVILRFVYDHPVTDRQIELVRDIEGEFWGEFSEGTKVSSRCEFRDSRLPRTLEDGEEWFYMRCETNPEA